MTHQHTKGPYRVKGKTLIIAGKKNHVADCLFGRRSQREHICENNAKFIARACNSHYELLEALTLAEEALTGHINTLETELGVTLDKSAIEKARKAIAKARGEA
jgi:hypothetical protein